MNMPTDREMNDLLKDGPSTSKFKKMLSDAEQRILEQVAPIQDAVDKHDSTIGFLKRLVGVGVKKEKRQV